jgi:hypothetical protein
MNEGRKPEIKTGSRSQYAYGKKDGSEHGALGYHVCREVEIPRTN